MSIDKVKQASAELFTKAAAAPSGHETTPIAITPAVISLCESLNAEPPAYVPVRHDPDGIYGFCNLGVVEKIKADGGTIRFGWNIWEYPGLYLTAEFHAVWADPAGTLIDITPKPDGETQIVFAGDLSYPPDFDFTKRPGSRRSRIYEATSRTEIARARIATFTPSQVQYETGRATKKGMTLEQWVESKVPHDLLPGLIDDFLRAADESDTLFKPIDPLVMGFGTQCTNPKRAMELGRHRQQKMTEILRLLGQQQRS